MTPEGKALSNIVILGFGFMLMFTAFQTCGNIEQTVIKSLNNFTASGYTSMSIIYGVFSASNLVAPSVVAVVGPQLSMFFSGLLYSAYIAMFIQPRVWSFYTASVLVGFGAAVLWTAEGNVLAINSTDTTIGRNSGLFWALQQFSLLFGNLYIYLAWQGHDHISEKDRQTVFISLTVISLIGCFLFFLIRKSDPSEPTPSETSEAPLHTESTDDSVSACKLSVSKEMMLLSLPIMYTGLELTFYSGVYGTCIGAMTRFGHNAKGLIGMSGLLIGVGEILGGGVFGILNNNRLGRNPVVLLGLLIHYLAFYLIFLNIAPDAPQAPEEGTDLQAYMTPNVGVALFCSFLLGLGDSCFNTQLLSMIAFLYKEDSAPAFAVFYFIQSIMAAIAFSYSNVLQLPWQLLLLVVTGFMGTLSFFMAEWGVVAKRRDSDYDSI
uniref:Major facilitator superfamily domain containing 11 n=1 Tax=Gadus morhua TaxID=8049 RepID=A0A8C5CKH7_GADMO